MKNFFSERNPALLFQLITIVIVIVLLARLDYHEFWQVMRFTNWDIVIITLLLNIPNSMLKTLRWSCLMKSLGVRCPLMRAFQAYNSAIFIGILTPGRIGEFVKIFYVKQEDSSSRGQVLSSVMADRLFDLYVICVIGGIALFSITGLSDINNWIIILVFIVITTTGLAIFISEQGYGTLCLVLGRCHWISSNFWTNGWLAEIRRGFRQLSVPTIIIAFTFTIASYALFYVQCYLLAVVALRIPVNFMTIIVSVSLGSLIAFLPISISGIGTRDLVTIAVLQRAGISYELSMYFSLLVFINFYIGGGAIGLITWLMRPVDVNWEKVISHRFYKF